PALSGACGRKRSAALLMVTVDKGLKRMMYPGWIRGLSGAGEPTIIAEAGFSEARPTTNPAC
ncbi:MAG: hypothetical protein PVJ53_14760, partial [Desulfobacterales bacterium]